MTSCLRITIDKIKNYKTNFKIDVAENSFITVNIFNINGQKVATLINENLNIGSYNVVWDGKSDNGSILSSGVYFYEMKGLDFHDVKKLILVK